MAREGAVAVGINRQQQSRVSLIIVNAIGERLYGMLGDEKRDVWGRGRSFRCDGGERVLSETRESKKASKEASSQGKARWEGNSKVEGALGWRVQKVDG
jgi:hypothetical protein